jgi:hypothetical protein
MVSHINERSTPSSESLRSPSVPEIRNVQCVLSFDGEYPANMASKLIKSLKDGVEASLECHPQKYTITSDHVINLDGFLSGGSKRLFLDDMYLGIT